MVLRVFLIAIIFLSFSQSLYALRLYTQDQYQAARDRAVTEARAGNHKSALVTLKRLLKLEPDNSGALNDYITILIWDKQYQKALDFVPTLNLKETPEYVLRSLVIAADRSKQKNITDQLIKIYFDKYPFVPQDTPKSIRGKTKADIALFLSKEKMRQTSLAILEQLIAESPDNQTYLVNYINTLFHDGQYDKALKLSSKVDFLNAPEFVFDALISSSN